MNKNKTYKICFLLADSKGIAHPCAYSWNVTSIEDAEHVAETIRHIKNCIRNSVKIYEQ